MLLILVNFCRLCLWWSSNSLDLISINLFIFYNAQDMCGFIGINKTIQPIKIEVR